MLSVRAARLTYFAADAALPFLSRASCGERRQPRAEAGSRLGARARARGQAIATMRSMAPRARPAISGSTVTSYCQSASEARSFSSVIIFM